jgi:outer membrane protein OmpA-like peptidoglycan-associated protein
MRRALIVIVLGVAAIALLLMPVTSYAKSSYFGVPNQAISYPAEFDQTDAAIAKAEKSPGARACADKIAKAKELAKKGVETYWACRTKEGLAMLADARKLAQEAETCAPAGPKEVIILSGVNFAFNSDKLTPESKAILDKQVAKIKADPGMKVQVAGHTDIIGSDAYNQKLSEKRAKAVMDYFISQGIPASRLSSVGYGKTKPIAPNNTDEGRAKNRRVELHIF